MPSPLGHALGGMAAGWLVDGRRPLAAARDLDHDTLPGRLVRPLAEGASFAAIGMAPDLDLLVGLHSTYTHSVAAVVLVACAAWLRRGTRGTRWAVACGAAVASHILLDWLGSDTTAPIGIMALWPFSTDFYQSPFFVFPAVSRRVGEWSFAVQNTKAALWEIAIMVPVTTAIGWSRRAASRG